MNPRFSNKTPLFHPRLDDWGLAPGTLVWTAGEGFVPIEEVEKGDTALGITYKTETDNVARQGETADFRDFWRPRLTTRRVLAIERIKARAWELVFGDGRKQTLDRRLVVGAETNVRVNYVDHEMSPSRRLVDLYTAKENPRTETLRRRARDLDREATRKSGQYQYRPSAFSGTQRGDAAVVVPFEHLGGQLGMIKTSVRPYNRYLFKQIHEVRPLREATLFKIWVQPDTKEEFGVTGPPRANIIAQTPFDNEEDERTVVANPEAARLMEMDPGELQQKWGEWNAQQSPRQNEGKKTTARVRRQDTYYQSQEGELAENLRAFGCEHGWINGGILLDAPHEVPDRLKDDE